MGHISNYRRVLIWGIGTVMAMAGAVLLFAPSYLTGSASPTNFLFSVFLFFGGIVVVVINETVFSVRRTQLEIDRDETIKSGAGSRPRAPEVLAICPQCKKRVPAESKYCLECGADLQLETPTPTIP